MQLTMVEHKGMTMCTECKIRKSYMLDQSTTLPLWYDEDGVKQYHLPNELSCLREAEKLLIAQLNLYVPLHHILHGQHGCKGHVCCFQQEVGEVCKTLPRLPNDVKLIRVVKRFRLEDKSIGTMAFSVRKQVVLDALRWLKQFNVLYHDIVIEENNLLWIEDGVEQDLPGVEIIDKEKERNASQKDLGPSTDQIADVLEKELYHEEVSGTTRLETNGQCSTESNDVCRGIEVSIHKSGKTASMPWPYVAREAVTEYDTESNVFPKAFPWLFPGGFGDYRHFREEKLTVSDWARRMLLYEDGRFAKDKFWGFFALNYATRQKNQSSGGYFVDSFYKAGKVPLAKIKKDIEQGSTEWIDKITYYTQRVKGSPGFWRAKRAEVYSWVNHHVQAGHGAPNFFITLSCAEYQWEDVKRLIRERFRLAGLPEPDLDKNLVEIVNDYTLIVQEYFQARTQLWLDTVGKTLFKIKHYWLRFEFAPSRGQIHAHMLAICDFKDVFERNAQMKNTPGAQAEFLRLWSEEQLGLTCNVPEEFLSTFSKTPSHHSSKGYFMDVEDKKNDKYKCMMYTQQHECNGYCLRKRKRW